MTFTLPYSPARTCRECSAKLAASNKSGLCRSHRMKALHADPEFAAARDARGSARMKALHADPEFAAARDARGSARMKALNADPEFAAARAARSSARMKALNADPDFNPLVNLTESERADYDILKAAGYTRAERFAAIGRAELAGDV